MARGLPIEQKDTDLMTDGSLRHGGESDRNASRGGVVCFVGCLRRGVTSFTAGPRVTILIGWAAMLIFSGYACTRMVAAGDTWVAMACGRHFVNHGVNTVEPFSVNSHKAGPTPEEVKRWPGWAQWITNKVGLKAVRYWHPTGWVNQNWLTHVIFYKLTTTLGSEAEPYYDALVLWKFALYIIAAVSLYYTARLYGVHPALAAMSVCFAMVIGRTFFDIRPAGFSNLLVAVFILILALASYKNVVYVWLLVPLVIFWSNVHGGYIYAFIMLIPFVVWHAIMHLPRRWIVAVYGILTWLVLCAMGNRFSHHEYLTPISLGHDTLFYVTIVTVAGSIALARSRKVSESALVAYHVIASCVLFLLFLPRFFPVLPVNISRLPPNKVADLEEFIALSRLSYVGIFSFAMVLGAVVFFLKDKMVRVMEVKGIVHTIAAGAVTFVAMVVFNPFHLTNLTHTFEISISKHAEQWRNVYEWQRAFNWDNPVGTAVPFLVMYILAWLLLIAWTILFIRASRTTSRPTGRRIKVTVQYTWPRIDLALLIIAAMTIYMAIRSRRFIPIAGFAASPVLALLIDQAVRLVAARIQFSRTGRYDLPALPVAERRFVVILSAVVVAGFGVIWGLRFKHVYLDPWPLDAKYKSVFMRMTASYSKPFEACEFIRQNKLSGVMYNYWTEGGAIAWGEEPDPNTGRIPLQLFMDGRAQAAYDVSTFDLWSDILSGGPLPSAAIRAGRDLKVEDYVQVGNWISERLRKHGVWVVLMPDGQFNTPFTIALDYSRDWRTVYTDDKQKLFVDITSPQGLALFQGIFTGQTVYPNEYLADLVLGHNLLLVPGDAAQKKRGLEYLVKALNDFPSPAPMKEMLYLAWHFPELRLRISQVCEQYVRSFEENKAVYARQDGYNFRLHTAWLALAQTAKLTNDLQLIQTTNSGVERYREEMDRLAQQKKW
jgi:hypothetical protein